MIIPQRYGAFTLPNTEPDAETETGTDTDKLTHKLMWIYFGICLCAVSTLPNNSVQPIFLISLGVGECEHTIIGRFTLTRI